MAKEERNYTREFKRQAILIYITMCISLISCIIGLVNGCSFKKQVLEVDTDTSVMNEVGVTDVLSMFEDGKIHVIYVGRDNCDACTEVLPVLRQAQIEMNFITQYVDITKIDRTSTSWKTLEAKLDVKTTTPDSENSEGNLVTKTFGEFLGTRGFTPCIMIIKDNKQVAGFFGGKTLSDYKEWLKENGL